MALENVIGDGSSAGLTEAAISAAGTTQATATLLRAQYSDIGTVASGAGVALSNHLSPGRIQTVFNSGANALKVYPPYIGGTGLFQINALAVNGAITLATNTGILFVCTSTTRIIGVLSA